MFCRASSYLTLVRHWAKPYSSENAQTPAVPLITVYDQFAVPVRATVQEVYNQIIQDLDLAEELLAEVPGKVRAQVPTIDAVYALKARYYLDVQDYASALDYADAVISSDAGYRLASSEADMHVEYTSEQGTEPIMQLYSSKAEGLVGNTYYLHTSNDDYTKYFSPYYMPTKALVEAYDKSDLRFKVWYCLTDEAMTDASLTATQKPAYPLKVEGSYYGGVYVFQKYRGNVNLYDGAVENGAHSAKTLLISEMYLIAAEAAAMNGDEATAKSFLNDLQKARQAVNTDGSMESVKKEWFRETVGEGLRLSCLKRWGDGFEGRAPQNAAASIVMTGDAYTEKVMAADSYVMNWPVPSYELKLNDNLLQNEGYEAN